VMLEEGVGNVKKYEFDAEDSARDYFNSRWVSRILVDPNGTTVSAKSGCNPLALRSIRAKLCASPSIQSPRTSRWLHCLRRPSGSLNLEGPASAMEQEVVVTSLSGNVLQLQLAGHVTISDIKADVENSWGVACCLQQFAAGTHVAIDSDTVTSLMRLQRSLSAAEGEIALQLTFLQVDAQQMHKQLIKALHLTEHAREYALDRKSSGSGPATVGAETVAKIARCQSAVEAFEEECTDKGIRLKHRSRSSRTSRTIRTAIRQWLQVDQVGPVAQVEGRAEGPAARLAAEHY